MGYTERLFVPPMWWLLALVFVASLWLAVAVALPGPAVWALTVVFVLVAVAALLGYGRTRISVGADGVRVGPAQLEWSACGPVQALDDQATRRLRGVEADARAYLVLRPYISTAVRLEVDDPADPTPYWLVSTRHPERLVAAVEATRPPAGRAG